VIILERPKKFRKKWSFRSNLRPSERWKKALLIRNMDFLSTMTKGFTLNVCCGMDVSGDVLMDVDFETLKKNRSSTLMKKDYVCADMFNLPFRDNVFDTVICDPPFEYYTHMKWVIPLANLARYRLILSAPPIDIKLNSELWDRELYYIETPGIFLRLWWVFTKRAGGLWGDSSKNRHGTMPLDEAFDEPLSGVKP